MSFPTPDSAINGRMFSWLDSANALIEKCKKAVLLHERGCLYVDIEKDTPREAVDHAISLIESAGWKAKFCRDRHGGHAVVRRNEDGTTSPVPPVVCLEIHEARPCSNCDYGSGPDGSGISSGKCRSCDGSKTV